MNLRQIKKIATFGASLLLVGVLPCASTMAAEWMPSKPVRIVVPIVGSTNDVLARLIAHKLQAAFGQPFIVDNRPGAGGNIGANEVAKATPDGHTLLVGYNGPLAINVTLFEKMAYDPTKDLAPITLAVKSAQYLVVGANSEFMNLQDFLAKTKSDPGRYSYGSVAMGSASHLTMEMFKAAAGFGITHIPYKGASPAVTDLIAGNIQAGFFVPGNVQQFVKEGRLRVLASTGAKRFPSTPNVPTINESGYRGFEATSWIGFLAPGGTPKHIVEKYHREIVKILKEPDIQKRLIEMEFEVVASTPSEFKEWIQTEIGRWGSVIRKTGVKAE